MLMGQPDLTVSLQILAGIFLAAALLFYIKRFDERKRLTLIALALSVAAIIYVLFALQSGNHLFIAVETIGLLFFLFFVLLGYKYSFWFVVLGWLLHVLWDLGVYPEQTAPYVPQWYAWLCVGFDVVMALYLITVLVRSTEKL